MKSSDELFGMINSKIKNNGLLKEEEWKGIIYYLYEENDAKLIESKIMLEIDNQDHQRQEKQISLTREEAMNPRKEAKGIAYNLFQKIILDFQIRCRVNFLKKFTLHFKSIDSDKNGIISESEFLYLLNKMSIQEKLNLEPLAQKLLVAIDPYNHKQLNYSDCINAFSKEMYYYDGKSDTVLNIIVAEN